MTMHNALNPRDYKDRLYVSRKEGVRRLVSIEENVDSSMQEIDDYNDKNKGRLILAPSNSTDNMTTNRTKPKSRKQ